MSERLESSIDYATDGGGFEIWQSSYITMTGNTLYNNENILETGTSGVSCQNNVFTNNICSGKSAGSTIDRSVGMIIRSAENMLIDGNTVTQVDWWTMVVGGAGQFSSSTDGLTVTNNSFIQAGDKIYALLSDPAGLNWNFDYNQLHSDTNSFGTDWNNTMYTSLPAWRSATRLGQHSTAV